MFCARQPMMTPRSIAAPFFSPVSPDRSSTARSEQRGASPPPFSPLSTRPNWEESKEGKTIYEPFSLCLLLTLRRVTIDSFCQISIYFYAPSIVGLLWVVSPAFPAKERRIDQTKEAELGRGEKHSSCFSRVKRAN